MGEIVRVMMKRGVGVGVQIFNGVFVMGKKVHILYERKKIQETMQTMSYHFMVRRIILVRARFLRNYPSMSSHDFGIKQLFLTAEKDRS